MPMYSYACTQCGNTEEHFHSIKETPQLQCSKCHSPMARQIAGGTSFSLKGGGWAAQGYSNGK